MILDETTIIELIKKGSPDWISTAQSKHKVLKAHVTGEGYVDQLNSISGFENENQRKAREKFAKSLKDVMSNILRPIDKVFSAKGSNSIYDGSEKAVAILSEKLSNFDHQMPIKKWIKTVQKNRYLYDPAGFVFLEWNKDQIKPRLYSICDVYSYKRKGRNLEYVVFAPFKKAKPDGTIDHDKEYFRVVHDSEDVIYVKKGDSIYRSTEDESFKNTFGYVPAVLNSDIPSNCLKYTDSILDVISEVASKYLRNDSIKSIYEFLHGYPIFWMYATKEPCKVCNATGVYTSGQFKGDECSSCHGVGHTWKKDVTTGFFLKPPQDKDAPQIAPNIAGYVQPDLETWREQRTELEWMYDAMYFALWGTTQSTKAKNETATAKFIDIQPVNDRLCDISESFEDMEYRLTRMVADYFLKKSIKTVTVIYGKRFMMERPDAIWEKYQNARKEGAPEFTKNHLLEQYYQSEFEHDPQMTAYVLRAIQLEPSVHYTATELHAIGVDVSKKLAFAEWWKKMAVRDVISTPIEKLKNQFLEYYNEKQKNEQVSQSE